MGGIAVNDTKLAAATDELARRIANIGYLVGMGLSPNPETTKKMVAAVIKAWEEAR